MDIGHNLFYNENTARGGDFLEGRTRFGEETMRRIIKANILLWSVCILLCGCTRREQLVLENTAAGLKEQSGIEQTVREQSESDQPVLREDTGGSQSVEWQDSSERQTPSGENEQPQTIFVHVCGAVRNPDVYELPAESRVYEAVLAAGGFTEEADSSYVNQAQKLSDGVKLVIPTQEQTQVYAARGEEETEIGIVGKTQDSDGAGISGTVQGSTGADTSSDGRININTASEAELCDIPGIGAVRAAAIVAYRQEKGGFDSVEDIMNVSGIKEGTYAKITDSITVK